MENPKPTRQECGATAVKFMLTFVLLVICGMALFILVLCGCAYLSVYLQYVY